MNTLALAALLLLAAQTPDRATLIVVVGEPGTPEYGQSFKRWADRWEAAAEKGGAQCVRLGDDPAGDQTEDHRRLEAALQQEPKEAAGPLWLVLIGHGTFDGRKAKFNLRGSDVTAAELAGWLDGLKRPVAVVNCASSSAPFINRLSGPNRLLVTATKSGYEMNYARFGDHLSTAVSDPSADLDKDQQTSLLESFSIASRRTSEFYETEGRLATETALLDDNGDALGTSADWFRGTRATKQGKGGALADGVRAHQLHLVSSAREDNMSPDMRRRRDELEQAISKLRQSKDDNTDPDQYYAQLEPLLVELARLYQSLDEPQANDAPKPSAETDQ